MRLSVRALRPARPELFVNYISCAFIAPQPPTTEKLPPPPQIASRAPGAPASRRPGCDGSAGPRKSQALQPGIWCPRRTARASRGGTRPPSGPGKTRSLGGPRRRPARTLPSCDQGSSAPTPRFSCPSRAALGHAPGERISGGLNGFCSPARGDTGHRSGGLHGLGRQPEDSAFPSQETEGGVGGDSRHLSPGLSPKKQPYLPRQSCTLTSGQGSRGRLGPPPA